MQNPKLNQLDNMNCFYIHVLLSQRDEILQLIYKITLLLSKKYELSGLVIKIKKKMSEKYFGINKINELKSGLNPHNITRDGFAQQNFNSK